MYRQDYHITDRITASFKPELASYYLIVLSASARMQ